MAPKKKNAPSAFMNFTFDWKAKYGRHMSIGDATAAAGKIWETMSAEERAPFKEKAKEEKLHLKSTPDKLTCTGAPVALVEKAKTEAENKEREIKRDIENAVSQSAKNNELETKSYYFIMVNYFTKTLKGGVYVPAELSVSEYSLKDGVKRTYHTLINPGINIFGHHYEAQHISDTTHKLPLPPNALGTKDLYNVYNDVLNFIRNKKTGGYPPLYTLQNCRHIVESVLEVLKADVDAQNIDLKIYPIQYLFFIMKGATCEIGELEKPQNFYITDAFFERDSFEFHTGLACQYHEENDRSKYCTKSCVTRWGYMFSDYMCGDIAIPFIRGRHCPHDTELNAIITPAPASTAGGDNASLSMVTTASYATKPLASSKIYYEDQKSAISDGDSKKYESSFPALGGAKKKIPKANATASKQKPIKLPANDILQDDLNPWTSRSRNVPREPQASDFSIDFAKDESDFDDFNSMASFGRGRASLANTSISTLNSTIGSGRGRILRR